MSARPSSTPIPSMRIPSIKPNRSKNLSPTCSAGKVDLLVILGGNPAYDAPADLDFAERSQERQNSAARSSRPLSERNRRTLSVAHQSSARTRSLGRCARLRRNRQHHSAADRSAVQRQERARIRRAALRTSRCNRLRSRPRLLAEATRRSGLRAVLAQVAARWLDRGHGLRSRNRVTAKQQLRHSLQR